MTRFEYYIDEGGTLHVFSGNRSVADVEDCSGMTDDEIDELIDEITEKED